jgi:hypothetical protein
MITRECDARTNFRFASFNFLIFIRRNKNKTKHLTTTPQGNYADRVTAVAADIIANFCG